LAQEIRNRIFVETGLTASAGISTNKFVAKIASDINKPNGQKQLVQMRLLLLEMLPIKSSTE
jgi:DNA polymerase-4